MRAMRGAVVAALLWWVWAPAVPAGGRGDGAAEPARPSLASPEAAPASCLDRTVDAIQARYDTVRDFSARFEQLTRPARIGAAAPEPIRSVGSVVVAKPARMRWTYESPEPSIVVSDGQTLWIYDPGFREAQRLAMTEGFLSGAAVQFLLGEGDMRRDFAISLLDCGRERVELELTPRQPASYEKLRVLASPTTGDLAATEVHDLLGNVTVVTFTQLEFNRDPPSETFRFEPPEGVTVIDLAAPVPAVEP